MKSPSILTEPPPHYERTNEIQWATKRSRGLNDTQTILIQRWTHRLSIFGKPYVWVKVPQIEVEN